ncbi:MAG: S-layer homology domain-containing protein, partial [Synergistaceae bacterium]
VDAEKASKQDLEMLKKLVMEFKDELDALGVKVDKIDKRVAVLEDGIGGWKIRGQFRFDAKFANSDDGTYAYTNGGKNEFNKERFRLFLTKQIDENTSFYAQMRVGGDSAGDYEKTGLDPTKALNYEGLGDEGGLRWSHIYVDTKLPYDIAFRVGRFAVDFEDDYGLYIDNDAIFGDFRTDGFRFKKSWGMMDGTLIVGRNDASDSIDGSIAVEGEGMTYALDLHFQPNEKFFGGLTGYWMMADHDLSVGDWDAKTYAAYAGFSFTPNIALKGIYYMQDLGADLATAGFGTEDSPKAWKAILDVKQDALKFTSLWVEYSEQDNNFFGALNDRYAIGGSNYDYVGYNLVKDDGTSKFLFVKADQKWNDKWSSFVRYANFKSDTVGVDDADEWGLGIGYQYSPAIYFELAYDQVDHGNGNILGTDPIDGTESVVRFRTNVSF